MPRLRIWSMIRKKIAVMNTIMNTIIEVIQVSRQVVQVILRASALTWAANSIRDTRLRGASGVTVRNSGPAATASRPPPQVKFRP